MKQWNIIETKSLYDDSREISITTKSLSYFRKSLNPVLIGSFKSDLSMSEIIEIQDIFNKKCLI